MAFYRPRPDLERAYRAARAAAHDNPLNREVLAYSRRALPLFERFGRHAVARLWLGQVEAAIDGTDWTPARRGRRFLTLPVIERRLFELGPGRAPGVVAEIVDILALDPDVPPRFWFRTGRAELLGGRLEARQLGRKVTVYATPMGWIDGFRAHARMAAELARHQMATTLQPTPDLPPPGAHGLCVLRPQAFDWYGAFAGRRRLVIDLPAFANALDGELKRQRRKVTSLIAPKPKVELRHG